MCLSEVWTDEQMDEWLAGQGEVIEVWKAVGVRDESYTVADCHSHKNEPYQAGLNRALSEKIGYRDQGYWSGFHFIPEKAEAENFCSNYPTIFGCCIKGLVKKEWITAIGDDCGKVVIVASQAIFPHYPEIEARLEDIPKEEIEAAKAYDSKAKEMFGDFACLNFGD